MVKNMCGGQGSSRAVEPWRRKWGKGGGGAAAAGGGGGSGGSSSSFLLVLGCLEGEEKGIWCSIHNLSACLYRLTTNH
jgi:hypothetical protein